MTLTGRSRLAGVLGWPVAHSRSPRLHGYWLEQHGIDGAYVPLATAPEDLVACVRALPRLGFIRGRLAMAMQLVAAGMPQSAEAVMIDSEHNLYAELATALDTRDVPTFGPQLHPETTTSNSRSSPAGRS